MRVRGAVLTALLALAMWCVPSAALGATTSSVAKVWTEPAAGYGFLDDAIEGARRSIDVSMYELADSSLEHDLIVKANAGLTVRVLLDSDYYGKSDNAASYALLYAGHVHVAWAPTNQIFHAKYVVVDDTIAYIGTGNLDANDYASTRDFWVEDSTKSDVAAILSTFNSDFALHGTAAAASGGLVWSPGSTVALVNLIESARHTLLVENEEMDSTSIEQALNAAAHRGVDVKIAMTRSASYTMALDALVSHGVHVHVLGSSQVYIHAKVICVDCVGGRGTVFVGSENFSTSSLSYNRELGLITTTPIAVRAVESAVNADYATGAPL
jgi:cardiolipin synthase